jgi:transcriptional regulator with PAS, ATPase and Fis domain
MASRVARTDSTVLLLGETGVGKEIFANRIHAQSDRRKRDLLSLNCAAMPEALLESELFGAEQGAFTGAVRDRPGLLEGASGGTVFLDEIGELPVTTQAKLLRVLEERRVVRLGGREPRAVDVRFIAATNRDLDREVAAGQFRQDLLFRLNVVSLFIPPLRERPTEIEPLARFFVRRLAPRMGHAHPPDLAPGAVLALREHAWPGNVRELRNVIERALVSCTGVIIGEEHLPTLRRPAFIDDRTIPPPPPSSTMTVDTSAAFEPLSNLKDAVEQLERQRILDTLAECGGNQTRAAKLLGISRRMLVTRLEVYGTPRPRKDRG